jgi:hypothetical protein
VNSGATVTIRGGLNRKIISEFKLKQTLFISTFSKNGYFVYGKTWIETFLEKTKNYPEITAKIYIDGMTASELRNIAVDGKIEVVDYNSGIPEQTQWKAYFESVSTHNPHVKRLSVKFSFKSFVITKGLKDNSDKYVIWLDADCIFKSDDLKDFAKNLLNGKLVACQKEAGSDHVESGIVIFDAEHKDKQLFVDTFDGYYHGDVNSFSELFDGFVINRTLLTAPIDFVDLNAKYGLQGVQSDPNLTFLNPEISKRFHHNIGITGKRNYDDWKTYSRQDQYFQIIHGIDPEEIRATLNENVSKINNKLLALAAKRL